MGGYLNTKNYLEYLIQNSDKLAGSFNDINDFLNEIHKKSQLSFENDIFLPFEYLFELFLLNEFERYVVLSLCLKYLQGEMNENTMKIIENYAKTDVGSRIECIKALSDNEKLSKFFIEKRDNEICLSERIISFAIYDEYQNNKISKFAQITYGNNTEQDFEFFNKALKIIEFCSIHDKPFVFIEGPDGVGKKQCVEQISKSLNIPILMVDLMAIVKKRATVLDDIMFEARISGCGICFYNFEILLENEDYFEILELINRSFEVSNLVICLSEKEWHPHKGFENYSIYSENLIPPTAQERYEIWKKEVVKKGIELHEDVNLYEIANKYIFTKGQIHNILSQVKAHSFDEKIRFSKIIEVCKIVLPSVPFGSKLIKINCAYNEEDLVVPTYSKDLLTAAVSRLNHGNVIFDKWGFSEKNPYGNGVSMIFAGPPGTGKTMGAQVVANLLALDIYKINLAGVVSKYIGESEKNLEEVFDIGRKSQAILFFDEADVLFSKRTEVKDSTDKYSNMEAAFMLQKIEEYNGICILATNFIQNFDEAFKRRIKYIVDFPFPDETYRLKIWQKVFPEKIPLSFDIDYKFLADKFELSGSNIKNVAINAAFDAARQNEDVGMKQIINAVKIEYAKSGKKITPEELGHYFLMY